MTTSFVAYIDESGDEGFKFLENERGSSRWFVISAAIFRTSNSLAPVEAIKRVRLLLDKPPKTTLHFKDLKHEQRVAYIAELAKEKMRCISVLVHKPSIRSPERYQAGKYLLYKYVTRLLIERISWMCRDAYRADEGDNQVELIFSDRAAMSYSSLKTYLYLLKSRAAMDESISIDWNVINPELVRAVAHSQLAGLQVADAIASGHFQAANLTQYGHAEPRHAHALGRCIYENRGTKIGYGLKFWPELRTLKTQMPHLAAFEQC